MHIIQYIKTTYHKFISFVLRRGLFLSLYSYLCLRDKILSSRRSNRIGNYIKLNRCARRVGTIATIALTLLVIAIVAPLQNITNTESTQAIAGTSQDSVLTFTSTRTIASVNLSIDNVHGTFASSTSETSALFSISTNNYTGYTLTISSPSNTGALSGESDMLGTIPANLSEDAFSANSSYNNMWGYKPNYLNSNLNSDYLPAPTDVATTLDSTSSANSTARDYAIALGVRADYAKEADTYTNATTPFQLSYVANPVSYRISFDQGSATETPAGLPAAKNGSVSVTSILLPNDAPTRTAYDFVGWCMGTVVTDAITENDTCTGTGAKVFSAGESFGIDKTTSNDVVLHAMWNIKTFTIAVSKGSNITSVTGAGTYKYGETVTLTATPSATNTCTSYAAPAWSVKQSADNTKTGTGVFSSTSGNTVTYTVGTTNDTIMASSTATEKQQTITFKTSNASGIIFNGSNYTNNSSVSVPCGTYDIGASGFTTGYQFANWISGAVSSTVKYSHTSNVSDAGASSGEYDNNLSTNEVVTIPGATKLHITLTYQTESASYDWVSFWAGNYPSYTASSNYSTGVKCDGNTNGKYGGTTRTTKECVVDGDTVTFGFKSDGSVSNYGYYAIVRAYDTSFANAAASSTTYNVTGPATITLNGRPNLYVINVANSNTTSSSASVTVPYGGSGGVTVTPDDEYYLSSVSCPSGYTCSGYSTGTSKTGSQTVNVKNNNSTNTGTLKFTGQISRLYLQDLTLANCPTTNTVYYDKRDNNDYTVKKINGECWMTQNLRFTGTSLDTTNSNVGTAKNLTYYSLNSSNSGGVGAYTGHCDSTNGVNYACIYDSGSTTTGVYYNFAAASAMYVTGASNSSNYTYDICPRNWHLPTAPNNTSGTDLNKLIGNTTSGDQSVTSGLTAFGVTTGGYYSDGKNSSSRTARYGTWWSASALTVASMAGENRYYLSYDQTKATYGGSSGNARYFGRFVRCVRSS